MEFLNDFVSMKTKYFLMNFNTLKVGGTFMKQFTFNIQMPPEFWYNDFLAWKFRLVHNSNTH